MALTCDGIGTFVKKGFLEKKLHLFRRHFLNWLVIGIRMQRSKGTSSSLTWNASFSLFMTIDEDSSFAFASLILSSTGFFFKLLGWKRSSYCFNDSIALLNLSSASFDFFFTASVADFSASSTSSNALLGHCQNRVCEMSSEGITLSG